MTFTKKIETSNFKTIDLNLVISNLSAKGEDAIDIKGNYLDELAHNTNDYKGSELGVIIDANYVKYGNNGIPMDFQTLTNRFINPIIPKTDNTRTGYWGAGASKIFLYKHGLPDYHCSIENGIFLYRKWEYTQLSDVITFDTLELVTDITLKEYEIDEDSYRILTSAEQFTSLPTFFISIKRWTDCAIGLQHKPDTIMDSLNASFMNVSNFTAWFMFNGKRYTTKQVYYPTIIDTGIKKIVPSHYSQLEKIHSDIEIIPNCFFDVYFYTKITSDKDGVAWIEIENQIGKSNIQKTKHHRLQNPRHIWINKHGVQLVNHDVYTSLNNPGAHYTNLVFVEKRGNPQYNTVKTSGINEELHIKATEIHKEFLKKNKKYNYVVKKGEDSKVDELFNIMTSDDNSMYQSTLFRSFIKLSNNELNDEILEQERFYEIRQTQLSREFDLIVSNQNNDKILHLEFMNNEEDNSHIDACLTRSIANVAKYNVLVIDSFNKNTNKIEYAEHVLKNTILKDNVWVVTYKDLLQGTVKNFKKIN
jgi:hypothetical protein